MKTKIHLTKEKVFIIILIVIIMFNIFRNTYNYRQEAKYDLEKINMDMHNNYELYINNKEYFDKNIKEINRLHRNLTKSLLDMQRYDFDILPSNNIKTIDYLFDSLIKLEITEQNIDEYYKKQEELYIVILEALSNMKFGDITNEYYKRIVNKADKIKIE